MGRLRHGKIGIAGAVVVPALIFYATLISAQEGGAVVGASRWVAKSSSLVLYDTFGSVIQEVGLSPWKEDIAGDKVRRHTLRGGVSTDGHFAWAWEKIEIFPKNRPEKVVEESRLMRYMGTEGTELWRDASADAPAGTDPVAISSSGEITLVAQRMPSGDTVATKVTASTSSLVTDWAVAAVSYTGNPMMKIRGKGPVESLLISTDGNFGFACFHAIDQPPDCSLMGLQDRSQRSVPLTGIPPVPLRLREGGLVYAGSKLIFDPRKKEANP